MKKKITIKGKKVHDVGYRLFLMDTAEDFEIENFDAKNLKEDGKEVVTVKIESSEENVNSFINFVKTNFPEQAEVDKESIFVSDCEDKIKPLYVFERSFNRHQMQKFVNASLKVRNELIKIYFILIVILIILIVILITVVLLK